MTASPCDRFHSVGDASRALDCTSPKVGWEFKPFESRQLSSPVSSPQCAGFTASHSIITEPLRPALLLSLAWVCSHTPMPPNLVREGRSGPLNSELNEVGAGVGVGFVQHLNVSVAAGGSTTTIHGGIVRGAGAAAFYISPCCAMMFRAY